MDTVHRKEIHLLRVYALVLTIVVAFAALSGFTWANQKAKFDEIDVARINIVEKDGTVKMVISNKERAPDAVADGKSYLRQGGNSPGIIFFNDKGDECGGLVFSGDDRDGKRNAGGALLFDQLNQDQTVGVMYDESAGRRHAGLRVWDRPELTIGKMMERLAPVKAMKDSPEKTAALKKLAESGEFGVQRVFVGKGPDQAASVLLCDAKGKPRLRLIVEGPGAAKIEFLDETGKVVRALPDGPQHR